MFSSSSSASVAPLRVASIPMSGDNAVHGKVAEIVARIKLAARDRVALAVFPEACLTGGIGDARKLRRAELGARAASVDGVEVRAIADAVERTGTGAGVGLIERAANGDLFSSYVVCLPGGERHVHRRLQTDGQRHLACGDRFTVFDTPWGWRLAVLVGGDNYLVENARMAALSGASLLVAPHARSDPADAGAAWMRRALPARALDNGMFVVYSADEGEGGAAIVDPCGRFIGSAVSEDSAGMLAADLDPTLPGASPGHRWLEARRPDLYVRLAQPGVDELREGARTVGVRNATARGGVPVSFAIVRRGPSRL